MISDQLNAMQLIGRAYSNQVILNTYNLYTCTCLYLEGLHALIRITLNRVGMRVSAVHTRNHELD